MKIRLLLIPALLTGLAAGCDIDPRLFDKADEFGKPRPGDSKGGVAQPQAPAPSRPPSDRPPTPQDPGAAPDPTAPSTGPCFGAATASASGTPNACTSSERWKSSATSSCEKMGGHLTKFDLTRPCGGDLFGGISYECCTAAPSPPASPAPPSACAGGATGSPPGGQASCQSADHWKTAARAQCTAPGAAVTKLELTHPCGNDLYGGMQFECCGPAQTAPGAPPTPAEPRPPQPGGPGLEERPSSPPAATTSGPATATTPSAPAP